MHKLASGLVNTEACQQALAPQIRPDVFDRWERERERRLGFG